MTFIHEEFPSPYGDFVFQPMSRMLSIREIRLRFRPLTGILFFNVEGSAILSVDVKQEFPSPYGDFVFQLSSTVLISIAGGRSRFRPLTGILFFNIS